MAGKQDRRGGDQYRVGERRRLRAHGQAGVRPRRKSVSSQQTKKAPSGRGLQTHWKLLSSQLTFSWQGLRTRWAHWRLRWVVGRLLCAGNQGLPWGSVSWLLD